MSGKRYGDPLDLGDEIEFLSLDSTFRGRVVALFKDGRRYPVVYRMFRDGDRGWPTGGYCVTSNLGAVRYRPGIKAAWPYSDALDALRRCAGGQR